jgi:AcrR family transcriptional regulator
VSGKQVGMGLRERKKLRTRQAIERAALDLFAERGFQAVTLNEIAQAAEVAPSTLHTYFRSKVDIVFGLADAVRHSARARLDQRPDSERVVDALQAWVSEELPAVVGSDVATFTQLRAIIDGDESLQREERLRTALLEDVLAEAFARDLRENADDLRSRLMASVAVNGLRAVWFWWWRRHRDGDGDFREPVALEALYLTSLIRAAEDAIEALPSPPEHVARG